MNWHKHGGVLIVGYEMFRIMVGDDKKTSSSTASTLKNMRKCLIDPGPYLIVFDEGHLLQNPKSKNYKVCDQIKTLRRIILTGTPLQNNLMEYFHMVSFVRKNILGSATQFKKRFLEPMANAQNTRTTNASDKDFIVRRAYVLQRILEDCVQRKNNDMFNDDLPKKDDYVVYVRLTDLQIQLFEVAITIYTLISFRFMYVNVLHIGSFSEFCKQHL